jgi:carboxyl-terminal processing protease
MKRFIFLLALPLLLSSQAFAEKKTPEEYWAETRLTTESVLRSHRILKRVSCYKEAKAYQGCVAAVNAVAAMATPALQLVPAMLLEDASMNYGPVVKEFRGFSLVEVKEETSEDSLRVIWERTEARRKKTSEAISELFLSTKSSRQPTNFETIFREVRELAVKDPANDPMAAGAAVSAFMKAAVDPHARIEPLAQLMDASNNADESFTGIGATLQSLNGKTVVVDVLEGSPALRSGVRPNDIIAYVDQLSTEGKKLSEVVKVIRGPEGSEVTLSVIRKGETVSIPIIRGRITLDNVEARVVEELGARYGLIKLRSFMDRRACAQIGEKVRELGIKGVEGLIFDLRSNGGGLLDQSVCIGGLFLGSEVVVKVKDLQSDSFRDMRAFGAPATSLPMVTLINGGSASASEILAGALQDHRRSWVLGERSFGKGTVQAPDRWAQGIVMYKTIQRFYQPSGRTNQLVGISPDIELPTRPDMSEDDRFVLREGDIYPEALAAVGPVWQQPRPTEVKKISDCLASGDLARQKYEKALSKELVADYQLLAAQEVLRCGN